MGDLEQKVDALINQNQEEHEVLQLQIDNAVSVSNAGDAALSDSIQAVDNRLSLTNEMLDLEVIHRSEGDLLNQGQYETLGKEFANWSMNVQVKLMQAAVKHENDIKGLQDEIEQTDQDLRDTDLEHRKLIEKERTERLTQYNKLQADVAKYLQILSDITLDSTQITLDNGEIKFGAWTILSQAREWDLQILKKIGDYQSKIDKDLEEGLEDIINKLPKEEDVINKALDELSNHPIIKEMDKVLNEDHQKIIEQQEALAKEAEERARQITQSDQLLRNELEIKANELTGKISQETQDRIDAIAREARIRSEQILTETEGLSEQILEEQRERIKEIERLDDGLTTEITNRIDGDKVLNQKIDNIKSSTDSSIANIQDKLTVVAGETTANANKIEALDVKVTQAGKDASDAKEMSASAVTKAQTAIDATTVLSEQMTSVTGQIENLNEEMKDKVTSVAFEQLKTQVTDVDGRVTTNTSNITSIKNDMVTLNGDIVSNTNAVNQLKVTQEQQGNALSQVASDTTVLKNEMKSVQEDMSTKVDSTVFRELSDTVKQQGDDLTTVSKSVTNIESTVDVLNKSVQGKADQTAVNAIEQRVSVNENSISSQGSQINSLGNRITTAEGNVTGIANAQEALKTEVNLIDGKVNVNTSKISTIEANLQSTNESLASVSTVANAAADKANANAIRIDNVNSELGSYKGANDANVASVRAIAEANTTELKSQATQLQTVKATTDTLGAKLNDSDFMNSMLAKGTLINLDPTFKDGFGGIGGYDNAGSGLLSLERINRTLGNPSQSSTQMHLTIRGASQSPGLGGFYWQIGGKANQVFIHVINMKVPVGYSVSSAFNYLGSTGSSRFYGNSEGTGKFDTYYLVTRYGAPESGNEFYGTCGYIYFNGPNPTSDNPLVVEISSVEIYECTNYAMSADLQRFTAEANSTMTTLTNEQKALAQRVDTVTAFQGKRSTYKIVSRSNANQGNGYIANGITNETIFSGTRSYSLIVFNAESGIRGSWSYDIYGDGEGGLNNIAQFNAAIASLTDGEYAVIFTSDEPRNHKEQILASLISIGGSAYNVNKIGVHFSYILIGRKGLAEGQGIEIVSSNNANTVQYIMDMINGVPVGLSGTATLSNAMRALTAEVTNVDGKVSAVSNDVTSLSTRVGNNEANLVNNYRTTTEQDRITSEQITSFRSTLMTGGSNLITGTSDFNTRGNFKPSCGGWGSGVSDYIDINGNRIMFASSNCTGFNFTGFPNDEAQEDMILSFMAAAQNIGQQPIYAHGIASGLGNVALIIGEDFKQYNVRIPKGTKLINGDNQGVIEFEFPYGGILAYSSVMLQKGNLATGWQPSVDDYRIDIRANATAVSTIRTDVSDINGRVATLASQNLILESFQTGIINGVIPGNKIIPIDLRDGSYGQDTYYPVKVSPFSATTLQTLRVTANLNNLAHPNWSTHPAGFSLNAQWQTNGAGWGTIGVETIVDNFSYSYTNGQSPVQNLGQFGESSEPVFWVRGGGYYELSLPSNKSIAICPPNGSIAASQGGRSVYPEPYKADLVPQSLNSLANDNKVNLRQTNEVVNGVRAVSVTTVDNNGFISGYGLISELVDGRVTSVFAVNADIFYVGNSVMGKRKPFIVTTTTQVIDGKTYPPGVWIDTAIIANATIASAQIVSLDAGKITTGYLSADRIEAKSISADKLMVGDTTNLWVNPFFDQRGPKIINPSAGRAQWNGGIAEIKSNMGMQLWGRDHYGEYSTRFPVSAGETFVIEFTAGMNAGPGASLGAGFWVYDAQGSGGTSPFQYGAVTWIANLGGGWARFRRTFQVANNGSGKPAANAVIYFQIEQGAYDANPTYWTVGDIMIRRVVDGTLIVNGGITADKIKVTELSAISANLGSIQVGTANIADLSVDTIKIKDNAVTSLIDIRKAPEGVESIFPPISAGNPQTLLLKSVIATGLNPRNRYLVYWRGIINLNISNKNGSGYKGESAKIIYFGSTSSTSIANSLEIGSKYASGAYYNHGAVVVGDEKQWNIAEGIVDETGALCIWASARWNQSAQSTAANSLYAYLSVNSLVVLISEFKK